MMHSVVGIHIHIFFLSVVLQPFLVRSLTIEHSEHQCIFLVWHKRKKRAICHMQILVLSDNICVCRYLVRQMNEYASK